MFYGYYDIWYLLCIVAFVFSIIASIKVRTTFSKYNKVHSQGGQTASEIARRILDAEGLYHVEVVRHHGSLTDHYDPRAQKVALSEAVYDNDTVGAIGIAAHEVGHAIQHAREYLPIKLRGAVFPLASVSSYLWYIVLIAGMIIGMMQPFFYIAIALFSFTVLFQLVTLPVEIDASARAVNILSGSGILVGNEIKGAKKVLTAAALTYVAALIASLMQLLRLLARARR